MKQSIAFCALVAGVMLSWGLMGCDQEADMEKGAIVEGTVLVGWEKPVKGKIKIPDGVTDISEDVFSGCSEITSVIIPGSVKYIGQSAFKWCGNLKTVEFSGNGLKTIAGGDYQKGAFFGCSGLVSITIPDTVTTIAGYAFYGCSKLPTITIPDSVVTVGKYAFCDCISLRDLTIGNGVECIEMGTFGNCTSLTSVTIPDSVTLIVSSAFYECDSLKTVYVSGDWEKEWWGAGWIKEDCGVIYASMLKRKPISEIDERFRRKSD